MTLPSQDSAQNQLVPLDARDRATGHIGSIRAPDYLGPRIMRRVWGWPHRLFRLRTGAYSAEHDRVRLVFRRHSRDVSTGAADPDYADGGAAVVASESPRAVVRQDSRPAASTARRADGHPAERPASATGRPGAPIDPTPVRQPAHVVLRAPTTLRTRRKAIGRQQPHNRSFVRRTALRPVRLPARLPAAARRHSAMQIRPRREHHGQQLGRNISLSVAQSRLAQKRFAPIHVQPRRSEAADASAFSTLHSRHGPRLEARQNSGQQADGRTDVAIRRGSTAQRHFVHDGTQRTTAPSVSATVVMRRPWAGSAEGSSGFPQDTGFKRDLRVGSIKQRAPHPADVRRPSSALASAGTSYSRVRAERAVETDISRATYTADDGFSHAASSVSGKSFHMRRLPGVRPIHARRSRPAQRRRHDGSVDHLPSGPWIRPQQISPRVYHGFGADFPEGSKGSLVRRMHQSSLGKSTPNLRYNRASVPNLTASRTAHTETPWNARSNHWLGSIATQPVQMHDAPAIVRRRAGTPHGASARRMVQAKHAMTGAEASGATAHLDKRRGAPPLSPMTARQRATARHVETGAVRPSRHVGATRAPRSTRPIVQNVHMADRVTVTREAARLPVATMPTAAGAHVRPRREAMPESGSDTARETQPVLSRLYRRSSPFDAPAQRGAESPYLSSMSSFRRIREQSQLVTSADVTRPHVTRGPMAVARNVSRNVRKHQGERAASLALPFAIPGLRAGRGSTVSPSTPVSDRTDSAATGTGPDLELTATGPRQVNTLPSSVTMAQRVVDALAPTETTAESANGNAAALGSHSFARLAADDSLMEQIADKVYRMIGQRLLIERESRGL